MTPIYGRPSCHASVTPAVTSRDTLSRFYAGCHGLAVTAVTVCDVFLADLLCKSAAVTAVTASRHSGGKRKYVGKSDGSTKYIHISISSRKVP